MSYEKFRLTDDAISTNGVEAAPDKLTGTTQENKKVFDRLIRAVVKDIINGLAEQIGTDVARFDSGEGKISAETAAALELDEGATLNDALVRLKNMAASGGIPTAEFVAVSKATAEAYGLEGDVTVDMVLQVIVDAITEAAAKSYTKEETLSPSTKEMLGLSEDAVPDDILAVAGQLDLHWWKRKEEGYVADETVTEEANLYVIGTYADSRWSRVTYYHSDRYEIVDGKYSLVDAVEYNPQAWEVDSTLTALTDKYFIVNEPNSDTMYQLNNSSGNTVITATDYNGMYSQRLTNVTKYYAVPRWVEGETEYVTSRDKNAYPDSGNVDGYTYTYLGVPFDNAREGGVKIVTGSYVGTGTYGKSNPCSLTFDAPPKMLMITQKNSYHMIPWVTGNPTFYVHEGSTSNSNSVTVDGNTISWYSTSDAAYQLNQAIDYWYIAIL